MKKTPLIAALIVFAATVYCATSSAQPSHTIPPNQICDPKFSGDKKHCKLEVYFDGAQWTTQPIVYFGAPKKVQIIWQVRQIGGGATKYGFKDDSLIVPANVTGFTSPCSTDDDDSCPGDGAWYERYRWYIDNPGKQQFDYLLKLYPQEAKPGAVPILVKVKAADKADDQKPRAGGAWVDPTIVIQG